MTPIELVLDRNSTAPASQPSSPQRQEAIEAIENSYLADDNAFDRDLTDDDFARWNNLIIISTTNSPTATTQSSSSPAQTPKTSLSTPALSPSKPGSKGASMSQSTRQSPSRSLRNYYNDDVDDISTDTISEFEIQSAASHSNSPSRRPLPPPTSRRVAFEAFQNNDSDISSTPISSDSEEDIDENDETKAMFEVQTVDYTSSKSETPTTPDKCAKCHKPKMKDRVSEKEVSENVESGTHSENDSLGDFECRRVNVDDGASHRENKEEDFVDTDSSAVEDDSDSESPNRSSSPPLPATTNTRPSTSFFSSPERNSNSLSLNTSTTQIDGTHVEASVPLKQHRQQQNSQNKPPRPQSRTASTPASRSQTPSSFSHQQNQHEIPDLVLKQRHLKEKKEAFETFHKLRTKQLGTERELFNMISKPSIRDQVSEAFDPLVLKQSRESVDKESKKLVGQVREVKENVGRLKETLASGDRGPDVLNTIKHVTETIEYSLVLFKETFNETYEHLLQEEKRLSQELALMEDRIASWSHPQKPEPSMRTAPAAEETTSDRFKAWDSKEGVLEEVVAFQEYLVKHGGWYGGWDDLSHHAFIKLRGKYAGNKTRFLDSCASSIPGISHTEAQAHETWYATFVTLLSAKKEAIKKWKSQKAALAAQTKTFIVEKEEELTESRRKELEEEKAKREEQKMAVLKWKEEQKSREKEALERTLKESQREAERREKEKKEKERLRTQVAQFVQQRAEQEAVKKRFIQDAERLRKKAILDMQAEELKRLKERDMQLVAKKKEKFDLKQKEAAEKEERLKKLRASVEVKVQRDPTRILKATQGFQSRLDSRKEEEFDEAVQTPSRK
ncbi:hypothetical protein HDV05_004355 [Chytridiales sp. JEL 0842]|nr:hypothetical protein HDV05_004355 [Chytridiales sp. JEL 0842]